jgi:hypothetical protein
MGQGVRLANLFGDHFVFRHFLILWLFDLDVDQRADFQQIGPISPRHPGTPIGDWILIHRRLTVHRRTTGCFVQEQPRLLRRCLPVITSPESRVEHGLAARR